MSLDLEVQTSCFGLKSLQAQNLYYKQSFDSDFRVQNMKTLALKPKSQIFVLILAWCMHNLEAQTLDFGLIKSLQVFAAFKAKAKVWKFMFCTLKSGTLTAGSVAFKSNTS